MTWGGVPGVRRPPMPEQGEARRDFVTPPQVISFARPLPPPRPSRSPKGAPSPRDPSDPGPGSSEFTLKKG